jgi:hypothetical protein
MSYLALGEGIGRGVSHGRGSDGLQKAFSSLLYVLSCTDSSLRTLG